jgi:hypothetical protein
VIVESTHLRVTQLLSAEDYADFSSLLCVWFSSSLLVLSSKLSLHPFWHSVFVGKPSYTNSAAHCTSFRNVERSLDFGWIYSCCSEKLRCFEIWGFNALPLLCYSEKLEAWIHLWMLLLFGLSPTTADVQLQFCVHEFSLVTDNRSSALGVLPSILSSWVLRLEVGFYGERVVAWWPTGVSRVAAGIIMCN